MLNNQKAQLRKGWQGYKEFTIYKTLLIGFQIDYKDPTISLSSNPQKIYDTFKILLAPTDFDWTRLTLSNQHGFNCT